MRHSFECRRRRDLNLGFPSVGRGSCSECGKKCGLVSPLRFLACIPKGGDYKDGPAKQPQALRPLRWLSDIVDREKLDQGAVKKIEREGNGAKPADDAGCR